METISAEEFKKRYGEQALAQFAPPPNKRPSIGEVISRNFQAGLQQGREGVAQIGKGGTNPFSATGNLISGVGKVGAGFLQSAFSPASPIIEPTIGKGINYAADKLSNISAVQKFANTKAGQVTSNIAGDVANYSNIAGTVGGAMEVPKVGGAIKSTLGDIAENTKSTINKVEPLTSSLKNAVRDVKPTSEAIINHQVTRALDLTQGDVKNISLSTGNEVGRFMADKNLIGENVAETQAKLNDFYKQNYDTVRADIAKVDKSYKQANVSRYTEALTELKKQVGEVPGLQESNAEVNALLKKKTITLNDVQRVKELMDDHFNLYKATGDVKEGIAKEGLANIRKDLKVFIEKEVKNQTGTDIKELNNNVATARSIMDAVETRSTRGLTRSHITLSDISLFGGGSVLGTPLFGAALVVVKKILQSPSIQLKIAKFLDGVSDAKKAAIASDLEAGKVPTEINKFISPKGEGAIPITTKSLTGQKQ